MYMMPNRAKAADEVVFYAWVPPGLIFPREGLMSDALNFAEAQGQYVELLPARTVLSTFLTGGPRGGDASNGGQGGTAGSGGVGFGKAAMFENWIYVEGDFYNIVTGGAGGAGGSADGGDVSGGAGVTES
jgi:hypothetical protein